MKIKTKQRTKCLFGIAASAIILVSCGKNESAQNESSTVNQATCTVAIDCKTVLEKHDDLNPDKESFVPENGVILEAQTVEFKEGESAFDVLERVCKDEKIQMEYSWTPVYNSAYVEGIGNLYEADCGKMSSWMYCVNGKFLNCSCSDYKVADGDALEWRYTCDFGKDIGNDWTTE